MTLDEMRDSLDQNIPDVPLGKLEETYHWAPLLMASLMANTSLCNAMGTSPFRGAVFTGPPGNGRHTTARALARSRCTPKSPWHFLYLSGQDLDCDSEEDLLETIGDLTTVLQESNPLCVLLEDPEDCRFYPLLQEYLATILNSAKGKFYLILVTEDPQEIRRPLRRQCLLCHCAPPELNSRKLWLTQQLSQPIPLNIRGMSPNMLAKETDGFSWQQLQDLVNYLKLDKLRRIVLKEKVVNPADVSTKLSSKTMELEKSDVTTLIESIRSQNPQPQTAMPVLQAGVVAAQSVQQEDVPIAYNEKDAQSMIDFHSHPENIPTTQLFDY